MKNSHITGILLIVLLLSCTTAACADRFGDTYTDQPPSEVLTYIGDNYAGYELEDYIFISCTTKENYGFALVSSEAGRTMLGFHRKGEQLHFWMKNDSAVPQGKGYVLFRRHTANTYISQGNLSAVYGDDLGFDVIRIAFDKEEYWSQTVSYHWKKSGFLLYAYMDRDEWYGQAYVTGGGVSFYDIGNDKKVGTVKGTVQRDIRYVSFNALPKTYAKAEKKLTVSPGIPEGELKAQKVKFTGGKKYEVYSAPSASSLRGGSGKAVVSTNDWIQVFGEEDGYILIQYAIDKNHMRFGYIEAEALPKGENVSSLTWRNEQAYLLKDAVLTDDPLAGQNTLLTLQKELKVTLLGVMGDWSYIETGTGDLARGFVKSDMLGLSQTFDLAKQSEGLASGTLVVAPDHRFLLNMTVSMKNAPLSFLLTDENNQPLGETTTIKNKPGNYEMQGELPENVTCICFIPVYSDGSRGEELFNVAW